MFGRGERPARNYMLIIAARSGVDKRAYIRLDVNGLIYKLLRAGLLIGAVRIVFFLDFEDWG